MYSAASQPITNGPQPNHPHYAPPPGQHPNPHHPVPSTSQPNGQPAPYGSPYAPPYADQAHAPRPGSDLPLARPAESAKLKRARLQDRDIHFLSLPCQDQPAYYDPDSDSDSSSCSNPPPPITTNRGHKLASSAKHVRRGRLGAFPNVDAGFAPASAAKRQRTLAGEVEPKHGFAVAPNVHLVPRALDIEDRPVPAHLPPASQTPLDLLLSTGLQATLGPRNKTFLTLALSATGLIEQEAPLISALGRVCAGLRGEGYEWRWKGDSERKDWRDKERKQEADHKKQHQDQLDRQEEATAAEEAAAKQEDQNKAPAEAQAPAAPLPNGTSTQDHPPALATAATTPEAPSDAMEVDSAPATAATASGTSEPPSTNGVVVESSVGVNSEVALAAPQASAALPAAEPTHEATNGTNQPESATASAPADSSLPPLPPLPLPTAPANTESAPNGDGPTEPVPAPVQPTETNSVEGEASVEGEGDGEADEPEEAPRRSGRRVASRLPDPTNLRETSESGSESEEAVQPRRQVRRGPAVTDEELPEYARRLIDPEVYVRSLFVSERSVEMPTQAVPGVMPGGVDILSPNEQEVMVHDCLT